MGACFRRTQGYEPIEPIHNISTQPETREVRRLSFIPDPSLLLLDYNKSVVEWNQQDGSQVGRVTVATIRLLCRNGTPYKLKLMDQFIYEVYHTESNNEITCVLEPSSLVGESIIRVSYTARSAGSYTATFAVNNQLVSTEFRRQYVSGPPDSSHTTFYIHSNHIVLSCSHRFPITFMPKDSFGNIARINSHLLKVMVQKDGLDKAKELAECRVTVVDGTSDRYELVIEIQEPGYYVGCVMYGDTILGLNELIILCLSEQDFAKVQDNLQCNFLNIGHKACIVTSGSRSNSRKVKCYLSPRLLQLRETRFLIPMRIFTCRVCNNTKLILSSEPEAFMIDDGLQPPIMLTSPHREIIAATYYQFVQRNIGSVTTFHDKQRHFWTELQKHHHQIDAVQRQEITISVKRFNLLESAMNVTSGFRQDLWKRKFYVSFERESGIDAGGVTREFFTCICQVLFDGKNPKGLFSKFKDNPQALVHPTDGSKRDPALTLNYFEFAGRIVGKCLYESALGNPVFVKARFTRSFLAQIIGLRVSWKHFETDDPDLYQYKVNYIKNNSIEELDLSLKFADDEQGLSDPKIVSLYPGGSKDSVNDFNKMDYLTKLAQHRLAKKVVMEIKSFLKGLHYFVPDELLGMFDENELELLMCGLQEINVQNLKLHTEIRGTSEQFKKVVNWFWIVVEEMTQEQLSRLVQFVTGSSQIPSGGFEELRPPFLLAPAVDCNNHLPYAHTCFNHLCLPDYDTFESFQRALITAINEGCEGVLLA